MTEPPVAWPGILQAVADVLGDDAAAAVALELGGDTLYLPKTVPVNHLLAVRVGRPAAELLCRNFGGERVYIPRARRRCAPILQSSYNLSHRQIASRLGVSTRTVRRYLCRTVVT